MTQIDRRHALALLGAAPLVTLANTARAYADPQALTIATTAGRVRGQAQGNIRLFTGIPFGRAARFAAPAPAPRWVGVFDATGPAHVAPQLPGQAPFEGAMTEDCLQLNIWAPATPGPHPVLVYIHGGANENGWSGDAGTAGDRFAADGVVCVTVNYRLGALGFLETGERLGATYRGSGNNGLRDQLLALRWVRANIAAFGGDPRQECRVADGGAGRRWPVCAGGDVQRRRADRPHHGRGRGLRARVYAKAGRGGSPAERAGGRHSGRAAGGAAGMAPQLSLSPGGRWRVSADGAARPDARGQGARRAAADRVERG
jgi:hypothetical protein